ncbi:MAG: hypothetical protein ACON4I_00480 [Candidatus Puniceispirillaceae bacterium]
MTTSPQDDSREAEDRADAQPGESMDRSVWLIWGGIMLVACAALPFVARGQDLFRSVAALCGFDVGSLSP